MTDMIQQIKSLPPIIESPNLLISDRCMVFYRREIERVKKATGLNCEIVVKDFISENVDGEDKVSIATIITDIKLEKAMLVTADFKSRLVATIAPDEVYIWRYRPRVRFQTGLGVDKFFNKFKEQYNTPQSNEANN